jgi:hypothetical protein
MNPYHPMNILSTNTKTGVSINLPIAGHCTPTRNCARCCYARAGRTALPSNKRKQNWVSNYLAGKNLDQLIGECKAEPSVRISATGDLRSEHVEGIFSLARSCPQTEFWGMSRKIDILNSINGHYKNLRLLLSVDSSSPASVWEYQSGMCWGPRLATDIVPLDPRIKVIFPYHCSGKVVKNIPTDERDCKAVRHTIAGCRVCGRCWNW